MSKISHTTRGSNLLTEEKFNKLKNELLNRYIERDTGCHEAAVCKGYNGFGVIQYDYIKYKAHVLFYMLHNDILQLENDKKILHSCKNKLCVKKEHLYQSNMHKYSRNKVKKLELSDSDIENVKKYLSYKISMEKISRIYNTSITAIKNIKKQEININVCY